MKLSTTILSLLFAVSVTPALSQDIDFESILANDDGTGNVDQEQLEAMLRQMQENGDDGMGGFGSMMGGDIPGMPQGGPGMRSKAVKSDVKYVVCETCQELVKQSLETAQRLRDTTPKFKFSEDFLDDQFENICDTMHPLGSWITHFDLEVEGDYLKVVKQPGAGKCKTNCKTMEAACTELYDEFGSDLVEELYMNRLDVDALTEKLCKKSIKHIRGNCKKKPIKIKASREPVDEVFILKSDSDLEMDMVNQQMRMDHPDLVANKRMVDEL